MRTHSRDVDSRRRTDELDSRSKTRKFRSVPSLGQLQDGEVIIITGQNLIVWRDGKNLYQATGTLVS